MSCMQYPPEGGKFCELHKLKDVVDVRDAPVPLVLRDGMVVYLKVADQSPTKPQHHLQPPEHWYTQKRRAAERLQLGYVVCSNWREGSVKANRLWCEAWEQIKLEATGDGRWHFVVGEGKVLSRQQGHDQLLNVCDLAVTPRDSFAFVHVPAGPVYVVYVQGTDGSFLSCQRDGTLAMTPSVEHAAWFELFHDFPTNMRERREGYFSMASLITPTL